MSIDSMSHSLRRAKRTYNEEGFTSLVKKSIRLAKTKKLSYIDNKYWDWKGGTQELEINTVSAEFDANSDSGGNMIRWSYLNERQMISDLIDELEPSDVLYDVGAHIGFFSCFAANHLRDGTVVSFEPHPPNVTQLRKNLSYNNNEIVTVQPIALSDSEGQTQFTDVTGLSSTTSFASEGKTHSVKQMRGDSLAGDTIPNPTVVKIDVEGAEPMVIEGMKETLSNPNCRLIYCEIHLPKKGRPSIEDYGYDLEQLLERIEKLGFHIVNNEWRGEAVHIKAKK
jgi:FkbM family methyltransferase